MGGIIETAGEEQLRLPAVWGHWTRQAPCHSMQTALWESKQAENLMNLYIFLIHQSLKTEMIRL